MPKYLSGRVKRTPQGSLTTDRYQYLGLEQAEPNLGDPPELDAIPSGQQYQVVSLIDRPGERFWVPIGGGIQPGSITIRDEGSVVPRTDANPNLGVSSITDVNFVGTAVTVVGFLNPDGSPGTAVTVTISPPGDNFEILFNSADGEFASSPNFIFDNRIGIGSVGIGTVNPTQNLHVVGNVKLDKTIYGEDNQPGNTGNLLVKTATGGVKWTSSGAVTSGAGGTITQIQFHDDTGLVGGASNFVFDSTNSRIGIGSTQPDRLLDVLGNSRFTGVTTFSGDVIFAGDNYNITFDKSLDDLVFDDNAKLTFGIGSTTVNLFYKPDTRDFRHEFNGGANYVLLTDTFDLKSEDASKAAITAFDPGGVPEVRLFNDGNEKLRTTGYGVTVFGRLETTDIFASGNVGIGTSITPHKLSVKGTISKISGDGSGIQLVNIAQDASNHGTIAINQSAGVERIKLHSSGTSYFNGGDVGIGTTNPTASNIESALESNTKVLAVGIITANQIFGKVTSIQETIDLETLNVSGITSTKNLFVTGIATFNQNVSIGGTLTYEDVTNVDSIGIITAGKGFRATSGGLSVSGVSTFIGANGAKQVKIQSQGGGAAIFIANYQGVDVGDASARLGVGENDNALIFTNASASQVGVFAIGNTDAVPLVFSTANTERLRIASDGKIGIGTTNPTQKLEIYDGRVVVRNVTDDAAKIVLRDDSGSYNHYQIRNQGGAFKIRNSGADPQYDALTIESGGNVGIGTNDPTAHLQVYRKTAFAGNPIIQARSNNGSTNELKFEIDGDGDAYFNGNVGIGTTNPTNNLQVNAASNESTISLFNAGTKKSAFQASNNFGTIIYSYDGEPLIFSVHSGSSFSEKLRITSDGNIGIGTANPLFPLHISSAMGSSPSFIHMGVKGTNTIGGGGGIAFDTSASESDTTKYLATIVGIRNSLNNGSNDLVFSTTHTGTGGNLPNEKLRITSDGNVGIGTDDPDGKLHVFKGFAGNVTADSDANNIVIESDTDPGVSFLSPNDEQARIKFADPDDTDVGAITYNHNDDTLSLTAGGTNVIGITSTKTTIEGDLDVNGAVTYSTVADVNSVGVITAQNGINVTGAGVSVVGVATFHDNVDILDLTEDRVVFVGAGRTLTDSSNLTFYEEREVLSIGGSVGIGTTNPSQELTVYGDDPIISVQEASVSSQVDIGTGTVQGFINIQKADGTRTVQISGNGDTYFNGGSVGIGTGDPQAIFHIEHSAPGIRLSDSDNAGAYAYFDANAANAIIHADKDNEVSDSRVAFSVDNDEKVRINSAGEVYIGSSTDNGQGKLFVNDSSGITTTQAHIRNAVSTGTAKVFLNLDDAKYASVGLENGSLVFRNSASSTPTERLRIDSDGKVGIGTDLTTTPSSTLTVAPHNSTSGRNISLYTSGSVGNKAGLFFNSTPGTGNLAEIQAEYKGTNQGELVLSTSMQKRLTINKDGDVGIGTTNPTSVNALTNNNATLAVGILTANQVFGSFQGDIVPDGDLVVDGNFKVTGISTFVGVTTFGNVGIGGSLPDDFVTNKFVVGDGGGSRGMTIYSDGTLGQIYFADGNSGDDRTRGGIVYDHSENELKFSVNAVEKFIIDSDGDVGIGTDDPTSKFDVHMNDKSGVNFLNISNNSAIDLKANQVESCGRIQVSESVGGGVMILSTKNTSGDITERLRMHTNGDVTTTGSDFSIANAGFTARKDDCVSITRASGTPLEINRTGNDGELIKFYQDGTEEANISINGDDLIFGNTTEKFRINSSGAKITGNLEVTGELTYEDVTNIDAVGIITAQNGIKVLGAGITVTGISTFYDNVNFQDRVLIGREVGTAIHGVVGHTDNQLQVVGTGTSCGISIIRYSNDDDAGSLTFAKSRSSTIGTNIAVQNGDELGVIRFNGADQSPPNGDIANSGARIRAQVTGHVTHDDEHDIPTSLFFDTSPDGLASPKERMSIRHDGLVGMGTTTAAGTQSQYSRLIVSGNNDSTSGYGVLTIQAQSSVLHQSTIGTLVFADRRGDFANITAFTDDTTGGSDFPGRLSFATTPDGATIPTNKLTILSGGNIGIGSEIPQYKLEVVGTVAATNFDSLSDRKVKTNIQIIQDPIEKIKKIDGVSFNWKSDNKPSLGVIADNVQSVLPEIVSNNDPKSVNYNGLIGLLIEVVKDQQKQIEELRGLIDK